MSYQPQGSRSDGEDDSNDTYNESVHDSNYTIHMKMINYEGSASGDGLDRDYASVSDLENICSSDKEENKVVKKKFKEFNPEICLEDSQFSTGLLFPSKNVLKKAIKMHGVNKRRDVEFIKDNNDRLRDKCFDLCKKAL
ncbi:hypothetical protein ACH5RR_023796 [Cinchona calisaya]|uniref:Uncharacterized protein n=1 Tax=Cinchona calisaya TaxID=153742 RepID=A0ABD2ZD47_9GENT